MISWLAGKLLSISGWQVQGRPPELNKYVIIVAPHTSNWDFFIFLLLKFKLKVNVNFIGKHTIFIQPFGWILRKLGGIPVNRNKTRNLVDSVVEGFEHQEKFVFALAPEGTRSYLDHWKSGFYRIAIKAKVPIQMCFVDKSTNTLGFGELFYPTGNVSDDLNTIKAFYDDKTGIKPELFSRIVFKE